MSIFKSFLTVTLMLRSEMPRLIHLLNGSPMTEWATLTIHCFGSLANSRLIGKKWWQSGLSCEPGGDLVHSKILILRHVQMRDIVTFNNYISSNTWDRIPLLTFLQSRYQILHEVDSHCFIRWQVCTSIYSKGVIHLPFRRKLGGKLLWRDFDVAFHAG